jgi:hypothetical protein
MWNHCMYLNLGQLAPTSMKQDNELCSRCNSLKMKYSLLWHYNIDSCETIVLCYKNMKVSRYTSLHKTSISTTKGLCCDATNLGQGIHVDRIISLLLYPQDDQSQQYREGLEQSL